MPDKQEQRHVYYDRDLKIEAYNLSGIVQKFPNHFHEYYVIGFVEGGKRHLWCKGQEYASPFEEIDISEPSDQFKMLCTYMEEHFARNITLDELLSMTSLGKSYLLRSFTRHVGVSPYRYLQTVRLDRAKKFLEQGIAPVDAADLAGFSDQSHFTNFFKEFIGLTPKQYQKIFHDPAAHAKAKEQTDDR